MVLKTYGRTRYDAGALEVLRIGTQAAIKEYYTVWIAAPRLDPVTGLFHYRTSGIGVPPDSVEDFIEAYNYGIIQEPALDEYFLHDRSLRESGHDTSYRLQHLCADLVTVYLNSLLYNTRTIYHLSSEPTSTITSLSPRAPAQQRQPKPPQYTGIYLDYNTKSARQIPYESATTLWLLWAGCASPQQATFLVPRQIRDLRQPSRLHQEIPWIDFSRETKPPMGLPVRLGAPPDAARGGLQNYGYRLEVQRLAYKWVHMMTKTFVEFNGVVVEKYDVTQPDGPHKIDAEYGN
ncbi:glycoside hydrolase [Aspergillus germanicus]